jgi:tetratricopeptide (TPR) repeat protein
MSYAYSEYRTKAWHVKREKWRSVDDVRHLIDEVAIHIENGRYDEAAAIMSRITFHYLLIWGEYKLVIEIWTTLKKRVTGDHYRMEAYNNLGLAHKGMGRLKKALAMFSDGLSIAEKVNNDSWIGCFNNNQGIVYSDLKNHGRAIEKYHVQLTIAKKIGYKENECIAMTNIGYSYVMWGQYEKALEWLKKALGMTREAGFRHVEGDASGVIGLCYFNMKQYEEALTYQHQCLAIAEEINHARGKAEAHECLGEIYGALGRAENATYHYMKAIESLRSLDNTRELKRVLEQAIHYCDSIHDHTTVKKLRNELALLSGEDE